MNFSCLEKDSGVPIVEMIADAIKQKLARRASVGSSSPPRGEDFRATKRTRRLQR